MKCWIVIVAAMLMGCGRVGFVSAGLLGNEQRQSDPTPIPDPLPPNLKPLLWEAVKADGVNWSKFIYGLLENEAKSIIDKPDDMTIFCPRYGQLSHEQKLNVAAMLISAIAKYESNFEPTARMQENGLGTDPITGKIVVSEGLLQLSYQDIIGRSYCRFDWNKDKGLDETNPAKSILNPYLNLECGLRILAEQIDKYGSLVIERGNYWAVIRKNGKYQKIKEISGLVQDLKYCQ